MTNEVPRRPLKKKRPRPVLEPDVEGTEETGAEGDDLSALTNDVDFSELAGEPEEPEEDIVEIPDALIRGMAKSLGVSADRVVAAMRDAAPEKKQEPPLILDSETNDYREATPEEQAKIAAGELSLIEPEDKDNPDLLTLSSSYRRGANARFHYRWAHIKPEYRTRELALGYVPVKESADGRHPVRVVPGVGPVVTAGDLILMKVPAEVAERRTAVQDQERLREQDNRMRGIQEDFRASAKQFGRDVELFDEEFSTEVGQDYDLDRVGTESQGDYAELAADAYAAALTGTPANEIRMRQRGDLPSRKMEGFKFNRVNFETTKDRQNRERGLSD